VAGTPWRSLTLVQVHTGKGVTSPGEGRMPGCADALICDPPDVEARRPCGTVCGT